VTSAQHITASGQVVSLQNAVLRTLLYYDIFNYPLTVTEIYFHCADKNSTIVSIEHALSQLLVDGKIFRHEDFYSLHSSPQHVQRRKEGNKHADAVMRKVYNRSKLISKFPFVRGVCILVPCPKIILMKLQMSIFSSSQNRTDSGFAEPC
jgi:hypothetical protein